MDLSSLRSDELDVFSTTRALREHKKSISSNCALNKSLTFGDFLERAVLVPGRKKADSSTCVYYLNKAVRAVKSASNELHIPNEFFAFLKSSEYIFSFFRELKLAKVDIKTLASKDIYANYDEHLSILQALKNEYENLLARANYYDSISEDYIINESYIKEFKKVNFYIDGILSKYEIDVLKKLCEYCEVIIHVKFSKFNNKLLDSLNKFFEFSKSSENSENSELLENSKLLENSENSENSDPAGRKLNSKLKIGYEYTLLANTKQILNAQKIQTNKRAYTNTQGFSLRSLQCAFVFDEISKMLRDGVSADEIVVILPDESFASILANADSLNMLNFAMGKSVKKTMFYVILSSISTYFKDGTKWAKNLLSSIDCEILEYFKGSFYEIADFKMLEDAISKILQNDKSTELENIVYNELFALKALCAKLELSDALKTSEIIELLLENISSACLSMSSGGAVTAMGVLESRGCSPKGVIIVDFNDDIVPKRSKKEMFLSSQIRANAGLASHNDRENLQKSYYFNLISNATHLSISYVKDDEASSLSRFYKELDLKSDFEQNDENEYEKALCKKQINLQKNKNLLVKYNADDFFATAVSYSKIRTFLDCREIFYYKYVLKIDEPKDELAPRDFADYGSIIHKVFESYFRKFKNSCDLLSLKAEFENANISFEKSTDKLEFAIFLQNLPKIVKAQNEHFKAGWRVLECEANKEVIINGIKIKGKIDRIDINENGELMVIDYKTGALPSDDLQLQMYKALSGANKALFFDLKDKFEFSAPKKQSDDLEEVLAGIKAALSKQEFDFSCDCEKRHKNGAYDELLEN